MKILNIDLIKFYYNNSLQPFVKIVHHFDDVDSVFSVTVSSLR